MKYMHCNCEDQGDLFGSTEPHSLNVQKTSSTTFWQNKFSSILVSNFNFYQNYQYFSYPIYHGKANRFSHFSIVLYQNNFVLFCFCFYECLMLSPCVFRTQWLLINLIELSLFCSICMHLRPQYYGHVLCPIYLSRCGTQQKSKSRFCEKTLSIIFCSYSF